MDLKIGYTTDTAKLCVNIMFFFDINVGFPLEKGIMELGGTASAPFSEQLSTKPALNGLFP